MEKQWLLRTANKGKAFEQVWSSQCKGPEAL